MMGVMTGRGALPLLLAAACALRGAEALALEARSASALRAGAGTSTFMQWLGFGGRKQSHKKAESAEYSAMTWQAAAEKATEKVQQMTPEEHLLLVGGLHNLESHYYVGNTEGVPKLNIPSLRMQDSSNGYRAIEDEEWNTTTSWPSPLALGATWDEDIIERTAGAIAREFKAKGSNVLLGPSLNVQRIATNGRNFEYFAGEDPYLGQRYAGPYIRAVQREGVIAVAKHFAFNEQETNRFFESSDVDAATAWNLYYPPFEAAVKSGVGAFMCSYNKVNGTQACGNGDLLKRDLRGKMGFKGFVMSDWMATHSATDMNNGLDQEMNVGAPAHFKIDKFTEFGPVKLAAAANNVLTTVYRLGIDKDKDCPSPCNKKAANARSQEHSLLAREAATKSAVLLKNKGGLLPLKAGAKKRLAIVGLPASAKRGEASSKCPFPQLDENQRKKEENWACQPRVSADYYGGGGSGAMVGPDPLTAVEAIRARARKLNIEVVNYTTAASMSEMSESEVSMNADVVLVFAATTSVESADRLNLALDDHADRIIARFARLGPTVVCMQTPGAVLTPFRDQAHAIVNLFLAGEETANAWAAVLFGDHNPDAKLPIAFPATKDDQILPGKTSMVPYSEGIWTSYRSPQFKWAYPFGHGLSYTTFSYGDPVAFLGNPKDASNDCEAAICVRLPITNTGGVAGREVVQAYVKFPDDTGYPKILKGFQKTDVIHPGKKTEVSLEFTERDLSIWVLEEYRWVSQVNFIFHIGSSSRDIRRILNVTRPYHGGPSHL